MDWREYPCDEWPGAQTHHGYGYRWVDRKQKLIHRLAWEAQRGPIPDGMCVLHHCDNRLCREVRHLFLGTRADNNADMTTKGRQARGESHPFAKLTAGAVAEIRRRYRPGCNRFDPGNSRALAEEFGVSQKRIGDIVRGIGWQGA